MNITVFTPTYNRAYIIGNLYQSLKRQAYADFEWLVVDDGSTDDTESLFNQWMQEDNKFVIRYFKQENGGKHRAINRGLDMAHGQWFFTVDSDDYLTDDALAKVADWCAKIENHPSIKGIVANRGYTPTETGNYLFKEPYLDKSFLDMYTLTRDGKLVLGGERAVILSTALHREYKYPEFAGEKFMTEAVACNRMAYDGYKVRFYNDIIWVFEYKEDGLTKAGSKLFLNNPRGYGLWLREKAKFESVSPVKRLKMYYTFTCDLSDRLTAKEIADCIGAPEMLVRMIVLVRRLMKAEVE